MIAPLASHLGLLSDEARLRAYATAIKRVVRPEHRVLDLGSGLGNLAVLAAKQGARVLAVDAGPVVRFAHELAHANGVGERVTVLEGRSTELTPPARFDVCIFDDFDVLGLLGGLGETLEDAARRWLAPQAVVIPREIEIWGAPVRIAGRERIFAPRPPAVDGLTLDWKPFYDLAARTPSSTRAPASSLLAAPRRLARMPVHDVPARGLNRSRVASLHRNGARISTAPSTISARGIFSTRRAGQIDGLLVWLRLLLCRGVTLDTGPGSVATAYPQILFPLPEPFRASKGERLRCSLECTAPAARVGRHIIWSWQLSGKSGTSRASTFSGWALPRELSAARGA